MVDAASVERFRRSIGSVLGLHFDDSKTGELQAVLESRLSARRIPVEAYLDQLENSNNAAELRSLAPLLTVSETFFFRHQQQLTACCEAVERWLADGVAGVRILSVGCASGEEPYSLAILLHDWIERERVQIVAGDINSIALERARRAEYSAWSLRVTDPEARARWFEQKGATYSLNPKIRDKVEFRHFNLADLSSSATDERYDVVFCRNVMMYFSPQVYTACARRLAAMLPPGGLLFLGHAETLRGIDAPFELRSTAGAFFYCVAGASSGFSPPQKRMTSNSTAPDASWMDAIEQSAQRIRTLSDSNAHVPLTRSIANGSDKTRLHTALELFAEERFEQALSQLRTFPPTPGQEPESNLLEAVLLVHQNRYAEATVLCGELIQLAQTSASGYYLLALCCEATGDLEGAIAQDEAATAADPKFAMPQLHLGRIRRRLGLTSLATADLQRARELLEREDAVRLTLFGSGFGRDSLLAFCDAELRQCRNSRDMT